MRAQLLSATFLMLTLSQALSFSAHAYGDCGPNNNQYLDYTCQKGIWDRWIDQHCSNLKG